MIYIEIITNFDIDKRVTYSDNIDMLYFEIKFRILKYKQLQCHDQLELFFFITKEDFMKRKLVSRCSAVLSTIMIAGTIAGCAGVAAAPAASAPAAAPAAEQAVAETAEPAGEGTPLYFYAWTKEENVVELKEEFDKKWQGKYYMEYEKLNDALSLTINTALASGDPISVMTQASASDLRQRADDGVYIGLKQFFDEDGITYEDTIGKSMEEAMNINGDYYGIPYNNNINLIFYNKKMFDEAGLEYPQPGWTWDDFRETCIALSHGEGADRVYGAMIDLCGGDNSDNYWDVIARQKRGTNAYYNDDEVSTAFDDPVFKQSLEYFYQLANVDKCIVPYEEYKSLEYQNDTNAMIGLYSGKFAMFFSPSYSAMYTRESYGELPEEGIDIGITNFPTLEGGKSIATSYTSTASIPASCTDPRGAWEMMKFICMERAELFAGKKVNLPGYQFKDNEEAEKYVEYMFSNAPGLDLESAKDAIIYNAPDVVTKDCTIPSATNLQTVIDNTVNLIFTDEMSIDDALKQLKEQGDAAVK